ncbi:amidohydrolase family protein [Conexibacter sp. CPCC 206217]|uniref:N-acyl-D-amino-acid deacylase family protein n=1 Tax=Conexibacter sp. CPCC 206217 TaxID=3064574 RepID=UPI00271F8607|nr:D-aminoacylase [Conexibacter sp. CPCC 206217]MDO8213554.1 D-aminoacylase [Conexibacter sp. CPCC 206217]
MPSDLLITGGLVFDGAGRPQPADVAVRDGRIEAVGTLDGIEAAQRIDASGLAVAPGFIDAHTHSDMTCFFGPEGEHLATADVRQGVTTEVCGNCGFSPFPHLPEHAGSFRRHTETLFGPAEIPWTDFDGYASAAEAARLHGNLAPLIGHGSLRAGVMGFDDRPASAEELERMLRMLDAALEQGVVGFSSGLIYPPGRYAQVEELIELARVSARYGRPYATHMRGETDMVTGSIEEAIAIARGGGCPLHISHHKVAGRENWGRTRETLAQIDRAAAVLDVTLDVYPYTAASTLLYTLLPPWAQAGGIAAMLQRLEDPRARERIRRAFVQGPPGWENYARAAGWDGIVISSCRSAPELEGRSIAALARDAGSEPDALVLDVLADARAEVTMVLHMLDEDDVERVLAHPLTMVGSDGIPLAGKPHPRWAGSFARVLGRYSRERGLLELGTAINKMTRMPAERFGLSDRGRVEAGCVADLVVLDPVTIADCATFDEPLLAPVGVRDVLVAGVPVVRDAQLTGATPGRVLRAR